MAARPSEQPIIATNARAHFGEVMRRAATIHTSIIGEKEGISTMVILSLAVYEQLLRDSRRGRFARTSRAAG